MTQKEYGILAAINTEGLDNCYWGMSNATLDTDHYGCSKDGHNEELPPHIYIWGKDGETYTEPMRNLLYRDYDRKYTVENRYDGEEFICFYWLDSVTM